MIYELRIYDCLPGRLPALLKRFTDHTLGIWDRHGIRQAGFFTTMVGVLCFWLSFFLVWDSLAERETKWAAFVNDPAWHMARDDSERDGPLMANVSSQFLSPTAFSSVK